MRQGGAVELTQITCNLFFSGVEEEQGRVGSRKKGRAGAGRGGVRERVGAGYSIRGKVVWPGQQAE